MKSLPLSFIFHLSDSNLPPTIGNKAANLRRLMDRRFRIPETFVCTWDAYLEYLRQESQFLARLRSEISQVVDPNKAYAVRSSANLEDDLEHSFAGQFSTILDARGVDGVLEAVQEIWDNTRTDSVHTYLEKAYGARRELRMAALIQEMIPATASGVAFSKNPITLMDEVLVEAVLGQGTSLVQDGVTPLHWVNKWGGWTQSPEHSPLELHVIAEVVQETKKIARVFQKEVDLEWVYDGEKIYWLQMRDITTIQKGSLYSNKISRETSPGMIKPLVWSVTMPNPTQAWMRLIGEVTGGNRQQAALDAAKMVKLFHYRAYYNMGVLGDILESLGLPRESIEMISGINPPGAGKPPIKFNTRMLILAPRLVWFLMDKWSFARKFERNFPGLTEAARRIPLQPSADTGEMQIQETIDQIMALNLEVAYYTVVTPLLMQLYNAGLRSTLRRLGVDHQQFDLTDGLAELVNYEPEKGLAVLHDRYNELAPAAQAVIQAGDYASFQTLSGIDAYREEFQTFIERFGHLSDRTTDFSSKPWRETPGLILQLSSSYQESHFIAGRTRFQDLPKRNRRLQIFYPRARQFRLYREQISSLFTYTLMLARSYYLEMAKICREKGYFESPEDIFYLHDHEIRGFLAGEIAGEQFRAWVGQRKADMERCQNAVLPDVIFGDEVPLIISTATDKLTGTPTSKGYYSGVVRIVNGVQDFIKLRPGDVLVIPYSDASWTPLFAQAGAVIAESGGILSHSSIIAREYNIPAVVSVTGALQLTDGSLVTVDGFKGEILIHDASDQSVAAGFDEEYIGVRQ